MSRFNNIKLSGPLIEGSNLFIMTVKSPALKGRGDISVYLPNGYASMQDIPMVVLLHGVYGSHWNWPLNGSAHITTQKLIGAGTINPVGLIMPPGHSKPFCKNSHGRQNPGPGRQL